jgi:hypothetical protein
LAFIIYLSPIILLASCVCLIILILKKNRKGIIRTLVIILVLVISLFSFYYPKSNILKGYNFNLIHIDGEGIGISNAVITDKAIISKVLKIINNHTFIRSAVKTVETPRFQAQDLIRLDMGESKGKGVVFLYILRNDYNKNLLQINNTMYNVESREDLSKSIINLIKEYNIHN